MDDKIKNAFSAVTAGQDLKRSTLDSVMQNTRTEKTKRLRQLSALAASIIVFLLFAGWGFYHQETAYISLDINPSLSLSINNFGKVIDVLPYNKEAHDATTGLPLKNQPYEQAIRLILSSEAMRPYIEENDTLWLSIQANDAAKSAQMEQTARMIITDSAQQHHSTVQVECRNVSVETRIAAEQQGITAAKLEAITALQQYDPSVTVAHYKHSSMHEIHAEIQSHHGSTHGAQQTHDKTTENSTPQTHSEANNSDAPSGDGKHTGNGERHSKHGH